MATQKLDTAPNIDICGKKTMEYVVDCLAEFNRGSEKITVRAYGANTYKALQVAHMLEQEFEVEIDSVRTHPREVCQTTQVCLELDLTSDAQAAAATGDYATPSEPEPFMSYPVYHLLFDSMLSRFGHLDITLNENSEQKWLRRKIERKQGKWRGERQWLVINRTESGLNCAYKQGTNESDQQRNSTIRLDQLNDSYQYEAQGLQDLERPLYRCGMLLCPEWKEIAQSLGVFDDVTLGVDTNILMDAALTEHLLSTVTLIDPSPYLHTPNWIFFVVPSAVMHEIENTANDRDEKGRLTERGRRGYRALGEILQIDRGRDMPGVALTIVGKADPELDTRVELQGVRKLLRDLGKEIRSAGQNVRRSAAAEQRWTFRPASTGDTIIRDQFREFLRNIDFHKGVYFLTGDKTNVALAETEGLHPIYYRRPPWYDLKNRAITTPRIPDDEHEAVMVVPLGKILYELAVQYGEIHVKAGELNIKILCDTKGSDIDHWLLKDLQVGKRDTQKLLRDYRKIGKFSLKHLDRIWRQSNIGLVRSES